MESAATVPLQLTQDRARIFRISHVDNLAWVLGNGLHALNGRRDSNFKNIGNLDLIDKRTNRSVPLPPGGTLSDYVPFYFTPYSIMMFNIRTGHGNITRVRNEEIMIFVSSLHRIKRLGIPFVFTNQHAYPVTTEYFSDLENLDRIDWALLQSKDFKGDPDDPGKKERYQAEALVYKHLPLDGLDGVICCSTSVEEKIKVQICERGSTLKTGVQPHWFF